jgi:hypothetical protein
VVARRFSCSKASSTHSNFQHSSAQQHPRHSSTQLMRAVTLTSVAIVTFIVPSWAPSNQHHDKRGNVSLLKVQHQARTNYPSTHRTGRERLQIFLRDIFRRLYPPKKKKGTVPKGTSFYLLIRIIGNLFISKFLLQEPQSTEGHNTSILVQQNSELSEREPRKISVRPYKSDPPHSPTATNPTDLLTLHRRSQTIGQHGRRSSR